MIVAISKLSSVIYRRIAKPLLFKLPPDAAHDKMIATGSAVQRIGFLRGLMRWSWAYQNPDRLSQTLCGLEFQNPLGLSAGLDKNFEIAGVVSSIGFGQMEGGSITFHPCAGNPKPWFYRLPKSKSLVVNAGLANHGARRILARLGRYKQNQLGDMRINVSVAYTNDKQTCTEGEAIADYIGSLKLIKKSRKAGLVTLNISCPNTYGGEPFTTPFKLGRLLAAVDDLKLDMPVFVKMPIDKTDDEFADLIAVILKHNIAGVTISNLFKDRQKVKLADKLPDSVPGNLSGKPTFDRSNQLIKLARQRAGDKLVISGVGGVFSAQDAYAKIRSGANLVQMVTALMFEGPQIVGQINRGLVKLLERDGFSNVAEAVGVDIK
jgi:dihydroorotate dehydrogenase (fumarate)